MYHMDNESIVNYDYVPPKQYRSYASPILALDGSLALGYSTLCRLMKKLASVWLVLSI